MPVATKYYGPWVQRYIVVTRRFKIHQKNVKLVLLILTLILTTRRFLGRKSLRGVSRKTQSPTLHTLVEFAIIYSYVEGAGSWLGQGAGWLLPFDLKNILGFLFTC